MRPGNPDDGHDVVDRALRQLPSPRAPRTLLPRVMAAAAAMEAGKHQPAGALTWFMWPRTWQAASVAALLLLVAGMAWVWPSAQAAVSAAAWSGLTAGWARTVEFVMGAVAVASVTSIVWEAFVQPIVGYLFVWIVLMSAASAAFAAALGRVALGGASHS